MWRLSTKITLPLIAAGSITTAIHAQTLPRLWNLNDAPSCKDGCERPIVTPRLYPSTVDAIPRLRPISSERVEALDLQVAKPIALHSPRISIDSSATRIWPWLIGAAVPVIAWQLYDRSSGRSSPPPIAPIPEPATLPLFIIGLLLILVWKINRKR